VALAGILACLLPLMSSGVLNTIMEDGIEVFNGLIVGAFVVCCGACVLTAVAIAAERREGTLELLFLTRVRPLEVLMGKLASCGLTALCAVLASSPMLMVPVLAGGVTGGEAARKALALFALLFLSLVVGLRSSVLVESQFKAVRNAILVLASLLLGPLLVSAFFDGLSGSRLFGSLSPVVTFMFAGDGAYQQFPGYYWISVGSILGLSFLMLANACWRFKLTPQPSEDAKFAKARSLSDWRRLESAANRFGVFSDPIEWLVRRQPGIQRPPWMAAVVVFLYVGFTWVDLNYAGLLSTPAASWCVWAVASGGWDALIGAAAARFFYTRKQSGELELLATTPLGAQTITQRQWQAMKKILRWPVIVSLCAITLNTAFNLNAMWEGSLSQFFSRADFPVEYVVSWFFDVAVTLLEVTAVCWVGMWAALKGRSAIAIASCAAAAGTGVPALLKAGIWLLLAETLDQRFGGSGGPWSWTLLQWIEQTVFLFYFGWLISFAKQGVRRHLPGAPFRPGFQKVQQVSAKSCHLPNSCP